MSRPLRVQDDPEVRKTKQKLMAGGKKWLPKKFGLKTRHKTDGKNTSNIRHGKVTKKKSK
jgi:hypothetical protein